MSHIDLSTAASYAASEAAKTTLLADPTDRVKRKAFVDLRNQVYAELGIDERLGEVE